MIICKCLCGVDPSYLVEMCHQFLMSLVVAAYVPQPAVIWLSREPKRQRTDHAVLQCWGQQAGTHYLNRSVTQPRHFDNSNADWKRRCFVWPTSVIWLRTCDCLLSTLLEWHSINVRTELNWYAPSVVENLWFSSKAAVLLVVSKLVMGRLKFLMLFLQDDEAAMNFVTSAANLRAFAFSIPLKSKFDIKCTSNCLRCPGYFRWSSACLFICWFIYLFIFIWIVHLMNNIVN